MVAGRYPLSCRGVAARISSSSVHCTNEVYEEIKDRRSPWQVGAAALAGAVLFYLVTNFAVWAAGELYPLTVAGLFECYERAIPYFQNSLLGDMAFSTILFGGLALLENRLAWMRENTTPTAA